MSFRWPELLWAVLLVPLVLLVWMRGERRRTQRAGVFGNPALLPNVVTARPGWRRVVPVVLYLLAATVLLLALARPEATAQVPRDQATIMLVMDSSESMLRTDVSPTRIEAARKAADAFLQEIPERFQVGIVSFAATPTVDALPTTDKDAVRTALRDAPIRRGTAVGDALVRALQASRPRGNPAANERPPTAILLLTDGESVTGVPPLTAAQQARDEKVPVFTVALAAQPPAELELRQVAEISGGQAFTAPTSEQLTAVYRDLGTRLTYVKEKRELTSYFMGGAAILLLLGAAASITWFLRIP
jgi:Ca-activated chloride channel homolog